MTFNATLAGQQVDRRERKRTVSIITAKTLGRLSGMSSIHLDEIINRHNQIANAQVVFVDIEKYSKRRTQSQIAVINSFTACLEGALAETARQYVEYTQNNNINLQTDIIKIPTGDGAALGFTFDGLHDIHLNFARSLLKGAYDRRAGEVCDRFNEDGWCNCHAYFNLRVGISEGKASFIKTSTRATT
jgi:hypothetical protein